ncbi:MULTISPECIES: MptD family putative ECF transporter S component [unclassified Corynebacterium]|uniref:MptD family putative ECF transporter S component n=1 Tax=unclassified Corynebacterium TaxID=2624378 RepID=UPI0035255B27
MSSRLDTRDFINVGIFTVIYFVVLFLTGMLGIISPLSMFIGFTVGLLLNGTVVTLYLARTPKMGALTLLSLLVGILLFLTGHPWIAPVVSTMAGFAGDVAFARLRGTWRVPVAYAFLSLLYLAPWMPMFYNSEAYFAYIADEMGQDYADTLASFLQPWTLLLWAGILFVVALIGGRIGVRIGRRSFARAGLA